jgi:methylenetetrahydrofolate--tRNA-(uracil-5-)-methyltransferase
MNANFGLFPPLSEKISAEGGKRLRGPAKAAAKKRALGIRAAAEFEIWLSGGSALAAE